MSNRKSGWDTPRKSTHAMVDFSEGRIGLGTHPVRDSFTKPNISAQMAKQKAAKTDKGWGDNPAPVKG